MRVLFSEDVIARRIAELGRELTRVYRGKELLCIALLNGGVPFAADLIRAIGLPMTFDTLAVESYSAHKSCGRLRFRSEMKLPVAGRNVLLIDDILDSGISGRQVTDFLLQKGAADVKFCVLLEKDIPRAPEALQHADYAGFHIPDLFVAGFGMDDNEQYRNLPEIIVTSEQPGVR